MTTISVNAALDTLHIRIPMQFSRRSSRKMIVGPDGKTISEMIDAEADNTDYTFISALGKAFSWQRMLDEGKYQTPKELAEKEKVEVKGGILSGSVLQSGEVEQLADLPPMDALKAQFLGLLQAPAQRLLSLLGAAPRGFLTVLSAKSEKKDTD